MEHPVKADVGCRNTVYHGKAQSGADYLADFIKAGARTFRVELLEEDAANEWVYERYKRVALEEIVAQEIQAFASIMSVLENLSDETIREHNLLDRVADNTFHHYRQHVRDIRRWLRIHANAPKK